MDIATQTEPIGGKIEIRPSLLASDFTRLGAEAKKALDAGVHGLHADIMDGRFVPPITFGADIVKALIEETGAVVDAHLMIVEPERQIEAFAKAGVRGITIHVEATPHLHRLLGMIRDVGCEAGVAINPATTVTDVLRYTLPLVDRVLIMTVNPGWGGQTFIPQGFDKVQKAKRLLDFYGTKAKIQVDGGVNAANAAELVQAGATELVAGSAIFGGGDVRKNIANIRRAIEYALSA